MRFLCCFFLGISLLTSRAYSNSKQASSDLEHLIHQSVSQGYDEEFIGLVEMVYGEGLLSQGGVESIEEMLQGIEKENRKILDIGSGLGGHSLYLAQHYAVDITGLEPQEWLFKRAQERLNRERETLKGRLQFVLMENPANLSQFPDESFDLVISKECLLHIPLEAKQAFFSEIARILKPEGKIALLDWMRSSSAEYSQKTQKMMEIDGVAYHLLTPENYISFLEEAGFSSVEMKDTSSKTADFSQGNISTIQKLAQEIQAKYGQEAYEYCVESWGYQRDAFASKELITGIFRAEKKAHE